MELRRQSADVLAELAREPGRMVAKEDLIDSIWRDTAVTDDSLVQCIADIRRTLGPGARDCVQTVPRRGYRLVPSGPADGGPTSLVRPRTVLFAAALALAVAAALTFRETTDVPTVQAGREPLVVLPFVNLSGDPEQRYLGAGGGGRGHFDVATPNFVIQEEEAVGIVPWFEEICAAYPLAM